MRLLSTRTSLVRSGCNAVVTLSSASSCTARMRGACGTSRQEGGRLGSAVAQATAVKSGSVAAAVQSPRTQARFRARGGGMESLRSPTPGSEAGSGSGSGRCLERSRILHGLRLRFHFACDRFRLQEQAEVIAAAGFGIGAGHVEAAERMHADERTGALAIEIEIADEKLFARAVELLLVVGEDRTGESELRVVGDAQCVVEVLRLDDCQHR